MERPGVAIVYIGGAGPEAARMAVTDMAVPGSVHVSPGRNRGRAGAAATGANPRTTILRRGIGLSLPPRLIPGWSAVKQPPNSGRINIPFSGNDPDCIVKKPSCVYIRKKG